MDTWSFYAYWVWNSVVMPLVSYTNLGKWFIFLRLRLSSVFSSRSGDNHKFPCKFIVRKKDLMYVGCLADHLIYFSCSIVGPLIVVPDIYLFISHLLLLPCLQNPSLVRCHVPSPRGWIVIDLSQYTLNGYITGILNGVFLVLSPFQHLYCKGYTSIRKWWCWTL